MHLIYNIPGRLLYMHTVYYCIHSQCVNIRPPILIYITWLIGYCKISLNPSPPSPPSRALGL